MRVLPLALLQLALVAACVLAPSARAATLLADFGSPVYRETFAGEDAFPLSPEIDTLGFGGMVGHQSGNPLPPLPTLTGTELAISVVEMIPAFALLRSSGAEVTLGPIDGDAIGLLGRFGDLATARDEENGQFQTAAVTLVDTSLDNGASAYLLELATGELRLAVSTIGTILSGYQEVLLTETAEDAIRAGDPFEVELLFDLVTRTAVGALTVGEESFTTPPSAAAIYGLIEDFDRALIVNTTTNNDLPITSIATDVDLFEAYVQVPEPGAAAAAVASLLALVHLARRRA